MRTSGAGLEEAKPQTNSSLGLRLIPAVLFVVVIGVRRRFERRSRRLSASQIKHDLDSRRLIDAQSALLTISNLGMIVYIIRPEWMAWSSVALPMWLAWVGSFAGVASTVLLVWSHVELGDNFSGGVKVRTSHQLVTSGPYRWVRHPMYTAFILLGMAWFFLWGNWFISGLWLGATALAIATRLNDEEAMMLREFGAEYEAYSRSTGRLFPGL
jgi:protein-S-isoprenylcysteine O-methyltransferase Ste14